MNRTSAPLACLLMFYMHSLVCADNNSDLTIVERVEFIRGIDSESSDEDFKRLIDLAKDNTRIPLGVLVPEPLTISSIVSHKLGDVRGNAAVQRLVLEAFDKPSISEEQFGILLRAINFGTLSDMDAAQLQELCIKKGDAFLAKLLNGLAASPDRLDEKFDLSITHGLSSELCISYACQAILNRQNRNLLWNAKLVDLCKNPILGTVSTAPDFFVPIDFRCYVLRALRKNGFPSSDVASFLKSFSPPADSELYWQLIATKYTLLNDADAFSALLDALGHRDFRKHAAKVLAQNVDIPSNARIRILNSIVNSDELASIRLSSLIIAQFKPLDFSESELLKLKEVFDKSYSSKRYETWIKQEQN